MVINNIFINSYLFLVNGFCNFFGKYDKEEETRGLSGQCAANQSYFMPTLEHPALPEECKVINCQSPICHLKLVRERSSIEVEEVAINISGQALLESEL